MNIQKMIFGFCAAMMLMSAAHGQDLIQNSTFDTDTAGWMTDPTATWSNLQNHDDEPIDTGGSLQISTQTSATASQCFNVNQNTKYILSVWFGLDPRSDFGPCASPDVRPSLSYMSGPECTGEQGLGLISPHVTPTTSWTNYSATLNASPGVSSALLTLEVSCGGHNGTAIVYFDDVTLTKDEIFSDGFDTEPLGEARP